MASVMAFLRRHIVMFGVVKFCAGLVIGFGLGVYFLPILIAEKKPGKAMIAVLYDSMVRRTHLSWICWGQMDCVGVMG